MAKLPVIYTIQASDAPQHTDRLRKILQNHETENRIRSFTVLSMNDDLSTITNNLGEEDMVLIVLTRQFELNKKPIENHFSSLKANQPKAKVAEILVDNVIYDNDFITFPADLKPIRNREDMDEIWNKIEQGLKDIYPSHHSSPDPPVWKKYAKYGLAVLVIIFLLIWLLPSENNRKPCIDESKINREAMCIQVYQPVCGCDGKTYGNSCEAANAGLLRWTDGECP